MRSSGVSVVAATRRALIEHLAAQRVDDACALVGRAVEAGVTPVEACVDLMGGAIGELAVPERATPAEIARSLCAYDAAERVLGFLLDHIDQPPTGTKGGVVVATPEGEWHRLPGRLLAEVLALDGYDVTDLGASIPAADLVTAVGRVDHLVAVAVSVATDAAFPAARTAVAALRDALAHRRPAVTVAVGGPAVAGADTARALGGDAWAPDARGFALLLDARLGTRPRRELLAHALR